MKTATGRQSITSRFNFSILLGVLAVAVLAVPFYSVDSSPRGSDAQPNDNLKARYDGTAKTMPRSGWEATLSMPSLAGETIEIFASDCTTAKTAFAAGETICAKTNGVDLTISGNYYVNWFHPDSSETNGGTITQNPQYTLFSIPTSGSYLGTWKANIGRVTPAEGSIIGNPPLFTVSAAPTIATFAADCVTPQTVFTLGDTVCAKVSGVDPAFNRRFAWVDPAGLVRTFTPITTDPQTDSFTLPNTNTSVIGSLVIDNRGEWKANVVSSRGTIVVGQPFLVQGTTATADLSISKSKLGADPESGSNITFLVAVTNNGPNPAENVEVSDAEPDNATFVSATQTSGPSFTCVGSNPVVCSRGTTANPEFLNPGEVAVFELVYTASGASGSLITNVATVESDTAELNQLDNTAIYGPITIGGGGGTPAECVLDCPPNMVVAANTTQGGQPAAVVNFPAADATGNCGTVTAIPASGSTFPEGTTVVNVTSSVGGGTCSFTVTVVAEAAPTITCPANQTVAAPSGQSSATVNVGSPSATGSGVTVAGLRSDSQHTDDPPSDFPGLTDPYPIGTTLIRWTATDQFGRTAGCTQTIVVTSQDAPTITCPSDKTFNAGSNCTYTATAAEIGTPTTTGTPSASGEPCPLSNPCAARSDGLALTDPFPSGQTAITWSAANDFGSVSCTQIITVNANVSSPPTLNVPPNVTVTTNSCGQIVGETELGTATASDSCGSVNVLRSGVPPGNFFPTGTTTITYTATNSAGTTTGTQTVTVLEDPAINPTITAPNDVTLFTGAGATSCGVTVSNLDATLGTATANDNCPGVTVARSGVPAGNVFPVGNTTVTYTATDRSGNQATDTQVVTVVDNTPPVVTPPAAVTLFTGPGATSCSVTVSNLDGTLGTGSATDNCPGVGAVSRSGVPSGNVFPVGDTILTYSATDAHGNTGTAQQVVTVVDNTAPVISCPANIVLEPTCPSGAIATYATPTATDNCGVQSVVRTAGGASGTVFPIGTTTVTHQATDIHGNTSSCSFTVTVKTVLQTLDDLRASVAANQQLSGPQRNGLLSKLDAAKQHIQSGNQNGACSKLADFVNSVQTFINHGDLSATTGNAWISTANNIRNAIGCTNNPCT